MIEERFIAIDNVCSWPNLTLMPDGAVIATIFNQPTHGGWEGDVECWISSDEGRIWTLQGIPAPHEPKTNRMNVAAGLARDGALVVLASGWSNRNPAGDYSSPKKGEVLPMWVCRSEDAGKTWQHTETVSDTQSGIKKLIPFGDIIHLPDNKLGACIYSWSPPDEINSNFYVSDDDGKTWSMQGLIGEKMNETAPIILDNGQLLAAARTRNSPVNLELQSSEDNGKTWKNECPLTLGGQIPGHILMLEDKKLLLTYGIRNKGLYGVGARISEDMGKTWSAPMVLVDFEIATDGGYPASVQFEDGTILTAYYSNKVPNHQRYHMGVIRWQLD